LTDNYTAKVKVTRSRNVSAAIML